MNEASATWDLWDMEKAKQPSDTLELSTVWYQAYTIKPMNQVMC